jgi:hypothetical protein
MQQYTFIYCTVPVSFKKSQENKLWKKKEGGLLTTIFSAEWCKLLCTINQNANYCQPSTYLISQSLTWFYRSMQINKKLAYVQKNLTIFLKKNLIQTLCVRYNFVTSVQNLSTLLPWSCSICSVSLSVGPLIGSLIFFFFSSQPFPLQLCPIGCLLQLHP